MTAPEIIERARHQPTWWGALAGSFAERCAMFDLIGGIRILVFPAM